MSINFLFEVSDLIKEYFKLFFHIFVVFFKQLALFNDALSVVRYVTCLIKLVLAHFCLVPFLMKVSQDDSNLKDCNDTSDLRETIRDALRHPLIQLELIFEPEPELNFIKRYQKRGNNHQILNLSQSQFSGGSRLFGSPHCVILLKVDQVTVDSSVTPCRDQLRVFVTVEHTVSC